MKTDDDQTMLAGLLLDHCEEMMLAVDAATCTIIFANGRLCHALGYDAAALLGQDVGMVEAGLAGMFYWQEVAGGNLQNLENAESELQRADGSLLAIEKNVACRALGGREIVLIAAKDVSGKLRTETELAQMSLRQKSILEATADGILAVSAAGRIDGMNHHFSQMWDIPEAILAAGDDRRVFEHLLGNVEDPEAFRALLEATDDQEHGVTVELRDGRTFEFRSSPQQASSGHVYSCNDITVRIRAERDALAARAEAEQANAAKGVFLANMSHEIRTPMTAIIGLSQLALDKPMPDEVRDYLEKIHASSQSLLGILNDILDISKIEAGKFGIESASFNLGALSRTLQSLFLPRAEEKRITLEWVIPSEMPVELIGDALRLQQVLSNLVGNAIKFTEVGSVRVRLHLREWRNSRATIRFEVEDTGIGISVQDQARLFQPFSQADGSITRRYGGTGLGLAISRKLVELMGGALQVDSMPGQGSTFAFELTFGVVSAQIYGQGEESPLRHEAGQLSSSLRDLGCRLDGKRVLVAEDNPVNQVIVREFLQLAGVRVTTVGDGLLALRKLEEEDFDAVLMDVNMPGMDGIEASRNIRAQARLAGLPVIALSAGVTEKERQKCLAAGMDDFVAKPIVPKQLIGVLCYRIRQGGGSAPPEAAVACAPSLEAGHFPGFELGPVREMLGGDEDSLREILRLFRVNLMERSAEIESCLSNRDFETARLRVHALKGMAGNVGAVDLARAVRRLEDGLKQERVDEEARARFLEEARRIVQVLETLD